MRRTGRVGLVAVVVAVAGFVVMTSVAGSDSSIRVTQGGFTLTCPTTVAEGSTLTCTLANTSAEAQPWPVVAILHLSSDDSRALVRGTMIDAAFGARSPAVGLDNGVWWIGDTLVGYSRFDWSGEAGADPSQTTTTVGAPAHSRTVSVVANQDSLKEGSEVFYVALGPDGSRGVGLLYNNKARVTITEDDVESSDNSLSSLTIGAGGAEHSLSLTSPSQRVDVGYEVTEATLTAEAVDARAQMAVSASHGGEDIDLDGRGGTSVTASSGEESAAVPLGVGATTLTLTVTAEDGTEGIHQIDVVRAALGAAAEVAVSAEGFTLTCPARVKVGTTRECTLVNGNSGAAPWPVVAVIHSSADDLRALVAEDPIIPDTDAAYSKDLSLGRQQPAREGFNYGYGELFSGGSRSVYRTYGYEKFDWSGDAAAGASRRVVIEFHSSTSHVDSAAEVFYVAVAPSGYTGLSQLVDNKVPIILRSPGPSVDTLEVTSTAGSHDAYAIGDDIEVTVTFDEAIEVQGRPRLRIDVGGTEKDASCARKGASGEDANRLVCSHMVAAGDADDDGISIAKDMLSLPAGASIKDSSDKDAELTHDAVAADGDHMVDGVPPSVLDVHVDNFGGLSSGDAVEFYATFSEDVSVSGSPTLGFRIGSAPRSASFDPAASSGPYVAFSYTLTQAADGSVNGEGVSVPPDSVSVPPGASIVDSVGNAATSLSHDAVDGWHAVVDLVAPAMLSGVQAEAAPGQVTLRWDDPNDASISIIEYRSKTSGEYGPWSHLEGTPAVLSHSGVVTGLKDGTTYTFQVRAVDAYDANVGPASDKVTATTPAADTTGPAVTGLAVSSSVPAGQSAYGRGAVVEVAVTFNEAIVVSGSPRLKITVGSTDRDASCARKGASGEDANKLVCRYTVMRGDADDDGISVARDMLWLPAAASIKDASRNDATLTHDALAADADHKVYTGRPWVSTLAVTSAVPSGQSAYNIGDHIEVTVTYNEAIVVSGRPQLKITVGSAERDASCAHKGNRGDDANKLVCRYTVAAGDADDDGISIAKDKLSAVPVGASITSRWAGNRAWTFHDALAADADHKVHGGTTGDAVPVVVSGPAIASSPAVGDTYSAGETVEIAFTFSEPVTVTGKPRVRLIVGAKKRWAHYSGGSGTTTLMFTFAVRPDDADADGISLPKNAIRLSGAAIADAHGNPAGLAHAALPDQAGHKVDGATGPRR